MKFFLFFIVILLALPGCNREKEQAILKSPDYPTARALDGINNDSAYYLYNQVVNYSEDSFEIGSAYNRMALMQSEAGDYFNSQETVLQSQRYLNSQKETDHYWIAANYDILGTSSLNLKQYDIALAWYDSALKSDNNPTNRLYYLNNKAVAYEKLKRYADAIALYQSVLDQKPDSLVEYARVLSNLAIARWLSNPGYPAAPELLEALAIRKVKNDSLGLTASYAQLSDFYSGTLRDSALYYAKQMYAVATLLNSADDQIEALVKLARLEQPVMAAEYFNRYIRLSDSIQQVRSTAKNQFAVIRFDAEKSKAENLVLQKDIAEKRSKITRQRFIFFAALTLFVSLIIIATLWYKKRKERFRLESGNAMKEQQLKMSKKVHDGVANGLYRLMTEIGNKEMEKETLLDKIEGLYEKSRDISYEPAPGSTGSYEERINELLSSFSDESAKILIVGNKAGFWKNLSLQIKNELEYVLQELMINMKKHSRAKIVVVKFDNVEDRYTIIYTDDGIGMNKHVKFGNGLKNTETRIKAIGGTLNFEQEEGKGLKVNISF